MGRQAAVVQAAPDDPSFLLDPANLPAPTFLDNKYIPGFGAFVGCFTAMFANYNKRRPIYAGVQVIIASTLVGFGAGYFIDRMNEKYWADRDAILRHYVQLHPEDFPPKERVLIGDMLKPWVPSR